MRNELSIQSPNQSAIRNPQSAIHVVSRARPDYTPVVFGELAAFARRRGRTWFVSVLNGPAARTLKIDLGFLVGARYDALVVRAR